MTACCVCVCIIFEMKRKERKGEKWGRKNFRIPLSRFHSVLSISFYLFSFSVSRVIYGCASALVFCWLVKSTAYNILSFFSLLSDSKVLISGKFKEAAFVITRHKRRWSLIFQFASSAIFFFTVASFYLFPRRILSSLLPNALRYPALIQIHWNINHLLFFSSCYCSLGSLFF